MVLIYIFMYVVGVHDIKSDYKENPHHLCVTFSELETLMQQPRRKPLLGQRY